MDSDRLKGLYGPRYSMWLVNWEKVQKNLLVGSPLLNASSPAQSGLVMMEFKKRTCWLVLPLRQEKTRLFLDFWSFNFMLLIWGFWGGFGPPQITSVSALRDQSSDGSQGTTCNVGDWTPVNTKCLTTLYCPLLWFLKKTVVSKKVLTKKKKKKFLQGPERWYGG